MRPVPGTGAIFGIGFNYADHVDEIGGEAPERPVVFVKLSSSPRRRVGRFAARGRCAAWTTRASWRW